MFVVIFEVQPKRERFDDYLELAKQLKPRLEAIDGFIDNERFLSRRTEGRLLSLSTWRDEKAVVRWRTDAIHHGVQEKGRAAIFQDYHLRVGEVIADTAPPAGLQVAQQRFDETEVGAARAVTITEFGAAAPLALDTDDERLVDHEMFESIAHSGKVLLLASWRMPEAAAAWTPRDAGRALLRHRQVRVIRDYGLFDRREAPQFHRPVKV